MLNALPIKLVVGTILGFLSGLGIGGGSLLILWLTLALGMDQSDARSINLLFFLPAAAIACFYRCKQGKLRFKTVFPGIAAGCCGAVLGNWLSYNLQTMLLRKLFGILLLCTGIRELLYKPKEKTSR